MKLLLVATIASACVLGGARAEAGWSPIEQITFDPGWSGLATSNATAVAADLDGRVHVVWHDERQGSTQVYYRSRDPSAGWVEPEAVVSHGAVDARNASVLAGPGGEVVAIWEDRRSGRWAVYRNVRAEGGGWPAAEEEISSSGADARDPTAVFDEAGRLHVAWQDGRDGGFRVYTRVFEPGGATVPQGITAPAEAAWNPFLARGLGTDLHLTWHETRSHGWKILYKPYRAAAGWDTTAQLITEFPSTSWDARLVVDPAGLLHVFWADDRAVNFEIYYKKRYPGLPWGDDKEFTSAANTSAGPRPVADGAGNIHVIWEDFRTGLSSIFYKKITAATGWDRTDTPLTDGLSTAWDPSVALDFRGDVHVVWSGNSTGNFEIFYRAGRGLIPTPVALRRFSAAPAAGGITLDWELEEAAVTTRILRRSEAEPDDRFIFAPEGGRSGHWTDREVLPGMLYEYRLVVIDREGNPATYGPVSARAPNAPRGRAAPNPFREATAVRWPRPESGEISAEVCDVRGRRVASLEPRGGGDDVTLVWDGRGGDGRRVAAGRYWIRVTAAGKTTAIPIALVPN